MTLVVVAPARRLAGAHRQHRLAAVERLDLGFLVDAQHDGALRRRHVEADHVAHLGDEIGIGGELEGLQPVRLQAEGAPDALHRRDRQPARLGHAARTPVRGVLGQALQRRDDHRLDARVVDRARRTRARLVAEPVQPMLDETPTPLADGALIDPQRGGDLLVLHPFGTGQHDPRPHRQRLRRLAPSGQRLQLGALAVAQHNLRRCPPTCHRELPRYFAIEL